MAGDDGSIGELRLDGDREDTMLLSKRNELIEKRAELIWCRDARAFRSVPVGAEQWDLLF